MVAFRGCDFTATTFGVLPPAAQSPARGGAGELVADQRSGAGRMARSQWWCCIPMARSDGGWSLVSGCRQRIPFLVLSILWWYPLGWPDLDAGGSELRGGLDGIVRAS